MSSTRSSSGNAAANFTDEQIKSLKQVNEYQVLLFKIMTRSGAIVLNLCGKK